jgi:hypothetical protein
MFQNFAGSPRCHQPRQKWARQPREREIDDVGVGEKIVKEGFDSLKRVRPAELEENHCD